MAKVLIPVDNQECTYAALESVKSRFWESDAKFLLLKVVEDFKELLYTDEEMHSKALSAEQEDYMYEMRMWLNEQTDLFSKLFPNTTSQMQIGNVAQIICETAYGWCADYIVMGSHDRQQKDRCALGSIASEVIKQAPCSIEAVRFKELRRLLMLQGAVSEVDIKRIVCPPTKVLVSVDMTPDADAVIDWVNSICWPEGSQIRLITVVSSQEQYEKHYWSQGVGTLYTKEGQRYKVVESRFNALLEKLKSIGQFKYDAEILKENSASEAILNMAKGWDANFLVTGAANETSTERNRDSTVLDVINHVHCSMALIQRDAVSLPKFSWV